MEVEKLEKELREIPQALSNVEIRQIGEDEEKETTIQGKGIVFGQRSEKLGFFYEYIDSRALDEADLSDYFAFFNHDPNMVLGRSSNNTVSLTITGSDASYLIRTPVTQTIRDLVVAPINRGDIRGSSFMFDIPEKGDEWEEKEGVYTRYIKKIGRLYEVGPVTMPAYSQTTTSISKRSTFDQFIQSQKQSDKALKRYYAQLRLQLHK